MSVSVPDLKAAGCSSKQYKALFSGDINNVDKKYRNKLKELIKVLSSRRREGMEACLRDYRTYWAVDRAYEAPLEQTTVEMIRALLEKKLNADGTLKALGDYGLSEQDLFTCVECTGPDGSPAEKKILNRKAYTEVLVPIVRAYCTIRAAGLYNERDTSPLLQYVPLKQTDRNRVLCDIVTDIVNTIATWYGYPCVLKDVILHMLKYGNCIAFTREEWHCEKQIIDGKEVVQKEGLRYVLPHPSKRWVDQMHPMWTLNTGTGCEFGLHWDVIRAGDVLDNPKFWNRNKITLGNDWFQNAGASQYFKEAFPCRMTMPVREQPVMSRTDKAAFYDSSNDQDKALFFTNVFWKLTPKDWGLGDYRFPTWHRFQMASDDTIVFAAPCVYNPMLFCGYDYDDQSGTATSMAIETIPWQNHLGNILSNMVRTARRNLCDFISYDLNRVKKTDLERLDQMGDQKFAGPQFIPEDSLQIEVSGVNPKNSPFNRVDIGYHPIVEEQQCFAAALSTMERVLQITAQEAGTTAAHYQSKAEVELTNQNGGQRKKYTGSGVDDFIDAMKVQNFEASQAYRDDKVIAQVSDDIPELDSHLKAIGFKATGRGKNIVEVEGSKKGLKLESFARSNVGPDANTDVPAGQVIFQTIGLIAQNEQLFAEVGSKRMLKLLEWGSKFMGAPNALDLTSAATEADGGAMAAQVTPLLKQLQQHIIEMVQTQLGQPVAKELAEHEQRLDQIEPLLKKLESVFQVAEAAMQKTEIMKREAATQEQLDAQKFAADEQRKNIAFQNEQQRKDAAAQSKLQVDHVTSQIDLQAKKQQADIDTATAHAESAIAVHTSQVESAEKVRASREQTEEKLRGTKATTDAKIDATEKTTDAKVRAIKATAKAKPKATKPKK